MGEIEEQWGRVLRCSSVTVDPFAFSASNRFSSTTTKAVSCICLLISKKLFWKNRFSADEHKQKRFNLIKHKTSITNTDIYHRQFQEAIISSASRRNAFIFSSLSSLQTDAASSSSSSQTDASSSLEMNQAMVTSEASDDSSESFCNICMDTKSPSEMFTNATVCAHQYCSDCICGHVSAKIKENITKVKCPDPKCKGVIGPEHCRSIVPKEVLERWEDALCESLILGTQKLYCPFKDCSAMLVDDGGEVVTCSECPNCNRLFCAQCKVAWHSGLDCREYKSQKKDEVIKSDKMLMELAKKNKWRRCPSCNYVVEKREGCNHISCRCGFHFCYGCGKKYDKNHGCFAL